MRPERLLCHIRPEGIESSLDVGKERPAVRGAISWYFIQRSIPIRSKCFGPKHGGPDRAEAVVIHVMREDGLVLIPRVERITERLFRQFLLLEKHLRACCDSSELIGDQAGGNLHLGISRALHIFLLCPLCPDGKKIIAADADEAANEDADQADNRRQFLTDPLAPRNVPPFRHCRFPYAWLFPPA